MEKSPFLLLPPVQPGAKAWQEGRRERTRDKFLLVSPMQQGEGRSEFVEFANRMCIPEEPVTKVPDLQ